uniref:Titin n=1 Tax=Cyprinus carpio TaxID=7962 RepID=A0A8C1GY53_CYPCA
MYLKLTFFIALELAAEFIARPQNQEAVEGEKAEFVCSVSKENYEVKWFKGDKEITTDDKYEIVVDGKRRALIVKNCELKDEGAFTAHIGSVKATEALKIIQPLEDCEIEEKKTMTFACKVNRPNVTVQWMKAGQEITFSKRILYRVDKDKHTLTIKDCSLADEGEYSVVAGTDKSTAELIISEAPTEFTAQLRDQTITEFEDAEFTCKLSKEKAHVKWYRNGREIREGPSEGKVHRLQVCEIRPRDQGEYRIVAKEKDARAKLELAGMIQSIPKFKTTDQNLVTDAGKPFVMTVPYDAYPRAETEWFYNDISLPGQNIDTSNERTEYRLKDPKKSDQGRYKIVIKNKHGTGEAFINLDVIDVPDAPQKVMVGVVNRFGATVSWEPPLFDGGSEITSYIIELRDRTSVKWEPALVVKAEDRTATLKDVVENKEYIFRVRAENKAGIVSVKRSILSPITERPSPPLNFNYTNQTKDSVQLSWETPISNGGSMITGYIIEKCEDGSDKWLRCNARLCPDLYYRVCHVVSGLKFGQKYHYRVCAENAAGISDPADAIGPLLADDPHGNGFKNGLEVIVPNALLTAGDRVSMVTKPTYTELVVAPSVRPDKGTYTLQLENDVTSVSGEIEVNVIACPSAPKDFKVAEVTRQHVHLMWEAPDHDGGSPVSGYNIEKREVSRKTWVKYTVTDVIEGKEYLFSVIACNKCGPGEPAYIDEPVNVSSPAIRIHYILTFYYITEPPEIQLDVKLLAGLTARAGTKIDLPADVLGKPEPRVKWTKADLVLKPADRITIDTKPGHSTLSIANTTRSDTATYIIEAVNTSGRATATVDVNILGMVFSVISA